MRAGVATGGIGEFSCERAHAGNSGFFSALTRKWKIQAMVV